ncbi:MAG: carboxypeptidase regulatory-like domain-containing protein [Pyrinomonadaceae bacterium]|nr:carboxypeptidase regulatory-like domain-containing protein [Pyrinomonadaceae bacterium]
MKHLRSLLGQVLTIGLVVLLSAASVLAQSRGALRGSVKDELGASIVGATITVIDASGTAKTTVTNGEGAYTLGGLAPGKYFVVAAAPGFAPSEQTEIDLAASQRQSLDLTLKVTIEDQKVTVAAETPLSTDATNNANQTLITGKDLDALPDDPDELAAALQALAGPSVGPNGGQIFIDGFSGGRLPPKDSIREIRINQNPFAAENDQPSGRIDILTRPGTDKLRGSSFFNFQDESLNSRNPFSVSSTKRSPFQARQYGGNLGGPLVAKKASFFVDFERRETDDSELVIAEILDENFSPLRVGFGVSVPRRNTTFSPRLDFQLNTNNTLITRYSFSKSETQNAGVGNFSLPERAFSTAFNQHTFQITETAVLNASMINETRFQFTRQQSQNLGDNSIPTLNVSSSFTSGGSQVGQSINTEQRWELQNFLAWQRGSHALKFGGRVRGVSITDVNPNNFGGSFTFTGGLVPQLDASNQPIPGAAPLFVDSLERYRRTLLGQRLGLTPLQIRALGGGASQFNIAAGEPEASVSQIDFGIYAQDDWRVRPNLTFSFGLRYEKQTNIDSKFNFAPRLAFAWSPGASDSARPPKMVIRGGGGVFYNRFNESSTLQANRFNGVNQRQFFVSETPLFVNGQFVPPTLGPLDAFPNLPPLMGLTASRQVTWRIADNLQAPVVYLGGLQVERQLPHRFTMFAGLFVNQIQHVIRARDINAPLPGSITQANPDGLRPFGNVGEIYQYESSGRFNQRQLFIGFNNRFNRSVSFFSSYSLSKTTNDTDGQGGSLFPANSYDLTGEFGRALFDVRHRFTFAGTINLPWWEVSLNPFIMATSGRPFNITTGQDTNGDRLFNERPSFAPAGVNCSSPAPNIVCTDFGNFNLRPSPDDPLIPRNFGEGPGFISVNMRVSKTWGFGNMPSSRATGQSGQRQPQGQSTSAGVGGGMRGVPQIGGGGGGGRRGPGGGEGGGGGRGSGGGIPGIGGPSGEAGEAKRYSIQFSLNFQNVFNKVNLSTPVGNLSSPFFGESRELAGGFGGFGPGGGGGGGGGAGGSGAGNRRVTAQVRFNF